MKRLTVVRHAKSDWGDPSIDDFQRPLNKRGLRDSATIAQRLLEKGLVPQCIVSSPALRALTTAQRFATIFELAASLLNTDKAIYEASSDALLDVVWILNDDYDDIMLVGHNPGVSELIRGLVPQAVDELSTCEVTIIQFDCAHWCDIDLNSGSICFNDSPRK